MLKDEGVGTGEILATDLVEEHILPINPFHNKVFQNAL